MEARIKQPVMTTPNAMQALQSFSHSAENRGVPLKTLKLIELRVSQINGCSVCVLMHSHELKLLGEKDELIYAVGGWFDSPFFTEAERAALALAEALTRVADRTDPVPDAVWAEAAKHYDEKGLAALVIDISGINTWNRLNIATRQVASEGVLAYVTQNFAAHKA